MAPAAIGTETNGSIVGPSSVNGVVGLKPTIGVIGQHGIVPISHTQDTAGPMAQTVADAQLLLDALTEPDTAGADSGAATLDGIRLGVLTSLSEFHADVTDVFRAALDRLQSAGAKLVHDLRFETPSEFRSSGRQVLLHEFKHCLNAYLAELPNECADLRLSDLIEFNRRRAEIEMPFFRQELFEMAEATDGLSQEYEMALQLIRRTAREEGIDRLLAAHSLDALVAVTSGPAWMIDWVNGDARNGGGDSTYAAVAGYPRVTVPMGRVRGLPVGMSLVAGHGADRRLLAIARRFERSAER